MNQPTSSYSILLRSATERLVQNHNNEAVIIAQTAAEVCLEQVLDGLYRQRGIQDLGAVFGRLLYNNFNIGHDRVASFYIALSGDNIKQASFWTQFKVHIELRNDIVHDGRNATPDEAAASVAAVGELIGHITRSKL